MRRSNERVTARLIRGLERLGSRERVNLDNRNGRERDEGAPDTAGTPSLDRSAPSGGSFPVT